jgi:general secretion pathway protein D
MPLRDFLNHVFGEVLKLNYVVPGDLAGLDQPVTLKTATAVSPRVLYRMVSELLGEKGIVIVEKEGVYFVGPQSMTGAGSMPIGFGRLAADVPDTPGTVLQVIPLRYGPNITIERTINALLQTQLTVDAQQNALFVTAPRATVIRVLDIVRMLDQPAARASTVAVINLTYIGIKEFITQISSLLDNEGISTGVGQAFGKVVAFVPLDQLGAVAVFAANAELLDRVEFWARQIDRPSQGPTERYFLYQPRYARAADLGESLGALIGASVPNVAGNTSRDTRSAMPAGDVNSGNALRRDAVAAPTGEFSGAIRGEGVTISVDPRSNSLILFTSGLRYEALLPIIQRLDVPPKQIVLEATIAEVSLTGEFAQGVEFAFSKNYNKGTEADVDLPVQPTPRVLSGGTSGGLGLPSSGLALDFVTNVTEQVRLRLSANDGKVNVLSSPILVVRDGVAAQISVGNDVPTPGATASDPIQSNRQVTSVLYRKTGLRLDILPTINAQGLVVMRINQGISNTVPGSSGVGGAPLFFERTVSTEVVAQSGQTVMLAGLISESGSENSTRVPWVSRLPLVGAAFRSDQKKREKTELVLLITPRVIESTEEWDVVRRNLESGLQYLKLAP